MNLFLLLGQLGLSGELSGAAAAAGRHGLRPVRLPRARRASSTRSTPASRFVVAGTPSGVTLAPEGGAHQSTITAVDRAGAARRHAHRAGVRRRRWTGCSATRSAGSRRAAVAAAVGRRAAEAEEHGAYYFRLTTRPIDQAPFEAARARLGDAVLRRQVLAGAYRLVDATGALDRGRARGAPGRLRRGPARGAGGGRRAGRGGHRRPRRRRHLAGPALRRLAAHPAPRHPHGHDAVGAGRAARGASPDRAPVVTVHDAASHAMAWLGSALGVPAVPLGVDGFGQSGTVADLYELHDLDPGSIVNAALAALSLR